MRLVKQFRGHLLPDIDPTITGARAKQWDEASQMAALQVHADTLPLASERAGEPRWRQAAARSAQDRCDVCEFDKPEIGRDAFPPYNHSGTVVAASAWLAFYVIAAIISRLPAIEVEAEAVPSVSQLIVQSLR